VFVGQSAGTLPWADDADEDVDTVEPRTVVNVAFFDQWWPCRTEASARAFAHILLTTPDDGMELIPTGNGRDGRRSAAIRKSGGVSLDDLPALAERLIACVVNVGMTPRQAKTLLGVTERQYMSWRRESDAFCAAIDAGTMPLFSFAAAPAPAREAG
jgi:hypothetical protein